MRGDKLTTSEVTERRIDRLIENSHALGKLLSRQADVRERMAAIDPALPAARQVELMEPLTRELAAIADEHRKLDEQFQQRTER